MAHENGMCYTSGETQQTPLPNDTTTSSSPGDRLSTIAQAGILGTVQRLELVEDVRPNQSSLTSSFAHSFFHRSPVQPRR